MKYTQILDTNMVPEWRYQYLDYHGLDAALNKAIESKNMKSREKGVDSYFELIKFNQKFANFFSRECQSQLDKINAFHREKLIEMKGKYNNLQDQLDQVLSSAIYRDIQPASSGAYRHNQENGGGGGGGGSAYETVSSISDLFRNLKSTLGANQRQDSAQTINVNLATSRPGLAGALDRLHVGSGGDKRSASSVRSSLAVPNYVHGNMSQLSSQMRLNRERVHVMARKLSDCVAHSAQKFTRANSARDHHHQSPVGSLFYSVTGTTVANNPTNGKQNLGGALTTKLFNGLANKTEQPPTPITRITSPNGNSIMVSTAPAETTAGAPETASEVAAAELLSFQSLAGATPQSKAKLIKTYKKKMQQLKFAFNELYFNLVLFEQYTQLNHNGFEQILRKHDRMFASTLGRKFYQEHVQTADFYNDLQAIDQLLENLEHIYTLHFENGNRRKAIEKLQVPSNVYKRSSPMLDFRVGYELGLFSVLFILTIAIGCVSDTGYDWRTVFRLYRSPLVLIVFLFQTGISIVIWKHYKINHVLIFELNPRNNLSFQHFIEFGSLLGILWSLSVIAFLLSRQLNIRPSICPLVVVVIIVIYLINPTQTCHHAARFWLLKILGRIVTAPFCHVKFCDFWIADQLVSIVPLFLDLEFLSCFYTTGDVLSVSHLSPDYASRCVTRNLQDLVIRTIVAALPAWFRCAQCLRRWHDENWLRMHLANAAKYGCMVMVVVLSSVSQYNKSSFDWKDTTRIVWLIAAIFTSSLTAYWDIIYDFGLFHKYDTNEPEDEPTRIGGSISRRRSSTGSIYSTEATRGFYTSRNKRRNNKYPFLRKELVYPAWVYYFAIVEDCILRFGWIITISLTEFSGIEAGLVVSLLAPVEMFRRFVWNCIRLENEQLNNCGLFRAVRDIPIEVFAPIDESHLDKVIMMMDSRDGPSMRNRLMKRRTLRPDRTSFIVLQTHESTETDVTKRSDIR